MKKKILLLANAASPHTEKWAMALAESGHTIGIFSLTPLKNKWHENHGNIFILHEPSKKQQKSIWNKLRYLFILPTLLRKIKGFNPDILHAHYASSYGLLGTLSKFKPFIISVWGSDVFEFPRKTFFHRWILEYNLKSADKILSTSYAMQKELLKYSQREVQVVNFGVDSKRFKPQERFETSEELKIGLIKSVEDAYGINTVVEAARLVYLCHPSLNLKFYIVGDGSRIEHYKQLSERYKISDKVKFTGAVPYAQVQHYHAMLDIFLNVPIVNESFGVSVLEAMASEKPVIVSRVAGLVEIVKEGTGIIIEKGNPSQLAKAIIQLAQSKKLRTSLGTRAREHVMENYEFSRCLSEMLCVYEQLEAATRFETYINSKIEPNPIR